MDAEVDPFVIVLAEPNLRRLRHGFWSLQTTMVVKFRDGKEFTIPAGSETDFASSRVGRWDFLSIEATDSYAAIAHDFFYQSACVTRKEADLYFYEGLLDDQDVSRYDAWKGYWGVRCFGWYAWNQHRKQQIKVSIEPKILRPDPPSLAQSTPESGPRPLSEPQPPSGGMGRTSPTPGTS